MVIFSQGGAVHHSPDMEQLVQIPDSFQDVQPLAWSAHGAAWGPAQLAQGYFERCRDDYVYGLDTCKAGCRVWTHPMDLNMQGVHGSYYDHYWEYCLKEFFPMPDGRQILPSIIDALGLSVRFPRRQWKAYGSTFAASRERIRAVKLKDWSVLYEWIRNAEDTRVVGTRSDDTPSRNRFRKGLLMEYMWLPLLGFQKVTNDSAACKI
jgi:hypothetical protein